MAVNLSPVGGVAAQFFTNTGAVLTGGKLFTYLAGTTTPATAYTSSQGTIAWTNPIVLDAAGRVSGSGEIWLTDGINYKFVLKDSNDVLIATYDNISGINSNFVAYTNSQEIQTATAGQTVFTLTTMQYQAGTNSLSVFVDGVNQYGPGAQYSYVETSSTVITFNSGLHVGAEVKFTSTQQQGAGAIDSSQVTYDPPFTGSVATNVESKFAQSVSVKDFGAVGDSTTDDTAAIQAAIDSLSNSYESATGIYFPAGIYKITSTLNVSLTSAASLTFYSDTKATINVRVPVATYAIDVDYSTGATANFCTFNMTNIALSDLTATQGAYGLRTKRVIASKFTQCEFNYLAWGVVMSDDSNLNTFDTCMWRGNTVGWKSTDGIANNNIFLNCQWRYHYSTAVDFTATTGNQIIGGDFEPGNANPVLIASTCSVRDTRFERNVQGENVRVLSNCDIEMYCYSDGGTQALPAVKINGDYNKVRIRGGSSAATFVEYASTAYNNKIELDVIQAIVADTSLVVSGPDDSNVIVTQGSIQSNTTGSLVEVVQDLFVPADLTTWTAVNCTVAKSGEQYTITGTGGTASISYTVAGTYEGLRMLLTTEPQNAAGQIQVSLGVGSANVSTWPSPGRRRALVALYDYTTQTVTNPVISMTLVGTGVGAQSKVWNVRTATNGKTPE
jgi:hypothetical protein